MNCQHRCSSSSSFYTDDKNLYATFPPIYELLGHLTHNFQLVLAHGVSWDLETSTDGSRSRVEDLSFDSPNIKKFNVSISVIRSRCMSRWDKQFQVYMKKNNYRCSIQGHFTMLHPNSHASKYYNTIHKKMPLFK